MPNNHFALGMNALINKEFFPTDRQIRVLSIGCGYPDKILIEYKALFAYFEKTDRFSYTGIDIAADLQDEAFIKLNRAFPAIRVIAADAANIASLQAVGILPNTFDLIILRHPNFVDEEQVAGFRKIVRCVIPYFLVTGGKLLVSVYIKDETLFFDCDKETIDAYFIKKFYTAGTRMHVHDEKYFRPGHLLEDSAPDKIMFCFTNKRNTAVLPMQEYTITYNSSYLIPRFQRVIEDLGGHFISGSNTRFTCAMEHAVHQDEHFIVFGKIQPSLLDHARSTFFPGAGRTINISTINTTTPIPKDDAVLLEFSDDEEVSSFLQCLTMNPHTP